MTTDTNRVARRLAGVAVMSSLALALASPPARAAGAPQPFSGTLVVRSIPAGGSVKLTGTLQAVGMAPFFAPNFPAGSYHIAVSRKGYYTRHSSVTLAAGDSLAVQATLSPKSRVMGFVRSAIVPGWGQSFNERPGRAAFYLTTEIVAAGAATYLATQYNHSKTRYNRIADSLSAATTLAGITLYSAKLADHEAAWQKHYDNAKTAAYVAAGVWALAAVDAFVFGPVREDLPGSVSLETQPASPVGLLGDPARGGAATSNLASASRLALTVRF